MKGIIVLIVILGLIAWGVTYVYNSNKRLPSLKSISTAEEIYVYPDATYWTINKEPSFCFTWDFQGCQPPAVINFQSNAPWPTIYQFYREIMVKQGWKTNTVVVTSVPTSVVFEDERVNCEAILLPARNLWGEIEGVRFKFNVTCFPSNVPVV